MGIRHWHAGKIWMIGAWGAIAITILWFVRTDIETKPIFEASILLKLINLLLVAAILSTVSIVLWIWFGGKDSQEKPRSKR